MKKFITFIMCFAAISAVALSCVEEEIIEVGEADADGCYNVYFDSDNSYSLKLGPDSGVNSYSIPIYRGVEEGAITVSFSIEGDDTFSCSDAVFADGEEEAEVIISFGELEIDEVYSCTLTIEDDVYKSNYSTGKHMFTFSVTVQDNWVSLGKGLYTDDIITGRYSSVACVTWWVEIEEKETKPGYYRMIYPYKDWQYNSYLAEDEIMTDQEYNIEIDATDPNAVYFTHQDIGINWSGMVSMWSYVDYYQSDSYEGDPLSDEELAALYGTLSEGVITFPASSLIFVNEDAGKFLTANTNSGFKLILPDYAIVDYSAEISVGVAKEGVCDVVVSCGDDVDAILWTVVEGELTSKEIASYVTLLSADVNGSTYNATLVDDGEASFSISDLGDTGMYTIVVVSCSAESDDVVTTTTDEEGNESTETVTVYTYEAQESSSLSFGYVANGDSVPFYVDCSAKVTSRDGADPQSTICYYVEGSDVISARIGVIESIYYHCSPSHCISYLKAHSEEISAEELETLNSSTLSGIISDLTPGTDYAVIVYATNGYEEQLVGYDVTTSGSPARTGGKISSVEDMIGTYTVSATYLSSGEYKSQSHKWVSEACDDQGDYINIKFTTFLNSKAVGSDYAIYGYVDVENSYLAIYCPGGYATISVAAVSEYYFYVDEGSLLVFDIDGPCAVSNPSQNFGLDRLYGSNYESQGYWGVQIASGCFYYTDLTSTLYVEEATE